MTTAARPSAACTTCLRLRGCRAAAGTRVRSRHRRAVRCASWQAASRRAEMPRRAGTLPLCCVQPAAACAPPCNPLPPSCPCRLADQRRAGPAQPVGGLAQRRAQRRAGAAVHALAGGPGRAGTSRGVRAWHGVATALRRAAGDAAERLARRRWQPAAVAAGPAPALPHPTAAGHHFHERVPGRRPGQPDAAGGLRGEQRRRVRDRQLPGCGVAAGGWVGALVDAGDARPPARPPARRDAWDGCGGITAHLPPCACIAPCPLPPRLAHPLLPPPPPPPAPAPGPQGQVSHAAQRHARPGAQLSGGGLAALVWRPAGRWGGQGRQAEACRGVVGWEARHGRQGGTHQLPPASCRGCSPCLPRWPAAPACPCLPLPGLAETCVGSYGGALVVWRVGSANKPGAAGGAGRSPLRGARSMGSRPAMPCLSLKALQGQLR